MNSIVSFLIEVLLTLILFSLLVAYLRPYLRRVLIDLCGTEERAQFWTAFSNILLIGLPLIFALAYRPEANSSEDLFFEIIGRISGNLAGFLIAMICIGLFVSLFALVAPKQKMEPK
jgi:tellurite resistance protein TehA-like permease